ncbi:MAG: hypothetical protein HQL66_06485, partial [Magnetococcales bacterium]|nr:hypothetical protein [Magnetococcales bacterium]
LTGMTFCLATVDDQEPTILFTEEDGTPTRLTLFQALQRLLANEQVAYWPPTPGQLSAASARLRAQLLERNDALYRHELDKWRTEINFDVPLVSPATDIDMTEGGEKPGGGRSFAALSSQRRIRFRHNLLDSREV